MCKIIIGGDTNSYISPELTPKNCHIYPDRADLITTMKRRTWVQPQVHKAD